MKESFVKYLAGLIDADGCLSFQFKHSSSSGYHFLHLQLSITASSAVDRNFKMLNTVQKETGLGRISTSTRSTGVYEHTVNRWEVGRRSELEMILPRLIKHMVIKARHFQRLLDKYRELKGVRLSDEDVEKLKAFSTESRKDTGPIKPKKHPTWAWVAGYIDGDGCFINRYYPSKNYHKLDINVVAHKDDSCGLELLHKAFKGNIYVKQGHLKVWVRNLGFSEYSFVKRFLPKLIRYSLIKRYQMEQILAVHNKRRKQRLIERGSTEQEKVQ